MSDNLNLKNPFSIQKNDNSKFPDKYIILFYNIFSFNES